MDKGTTEASVDQGAGDQGLMFGYACSETKNLMPIAINSSPTCLKTGVFKKKQSGLVKTRCEITSNN